MTLLIYSATRTIAKTLCEDNFLDVMDRFALTVLFIPVFCLETILLPVSILLHFIVNKFASRDNGD